MTCRQRRRLERGAHGAGLGGNRGHPPVSNAARNDALEHRQVGVDVEGEAMHGPTSGAAHAHRAHLAGARAVRVNPDTGIPVQAAHLAAYSGNYAGWTEWSAQSEMLPYMEQGAIFNAINFAFCGGYDYGSQCNGTSWTAVIPIVPVTARLPLMVSPPPVASRLGLGAATATLLFTTYMVEEPLLSPGTALVMVRPLTAVGAVCPPVMRMPRPAC